MPSGYAPAYKNTLCGFTLLSIVSAGPKIQIFGLYFGFYIPSCKGKNWLTNIQRSFLDELFSICVLSLKFDFSKQLCSQNYILVFMAFIRHKGQKKITYFKRILIRNFSYLCSNSEFLVLLGISRAKNWILAFFGAKAKFK